MLQLQQRGDDIDNHSGVNMVLEVVMQVSKSNMDADGFDASLSQRRPDCVRRDFSAFITQMNEKYNFVGIVKGMLTKKYRVDGVEKYALDTDVADDLIDELRDACTTINSKSKKHFFKLSFIQNIFLKK